MQAPWSIQKLALDTSRLRIDFDLTCDVSRLPCSHCDAPAQAVHDRLTREWRHLDFFQFEAWLRAEVPRFACSACGKTSQIHFSWSREGSGFTALFEALALSLCQELPVRRASAPLRCSDKQLWRHIEQYVIAVRMLEEMSLVSIVGIDETSLRKGQNYITIVHDFDLKRLLYACEGPDHKTWYALLMTSRSTGDSPARSKMSARTLVRPTPRGWHRRCPRPRLAMTDFMRLQ